MIVGVWHGWITQEFLDALQNPNQPSARRVRQCGIRGAEVVLPDAWQVGQPATFIIETRINRNRTITEQRPITMLVIHIFPRLSNLPATITNLLELKGLLSYHNAKFIHSSFEDAFETTFKMPSQTSTVQTLTMPSADELPVGTLVHGEWEVVRKLGSGGMGQVYEVRHRILGWRAALKKCQPDSPDPFERNLQYQQFIQEARILASLSHPNIVRIYDCWDAATTQAVYILEEFVDGKPLSQFIPSPEPFVLWVGQVMCEVLEVIHSKNLIHRDIKPDNIIIIQTTQQQSLKLIDFGIARRYRPGAPTDTQHFGTEGYAPPEQYGLSQTDCRSDIYSLAATLYHLLFDDDPRLHPFQFPKLNQTNAAIAKVLKKALNPDPAQRYQTAREFKEALMRC